jgi:hypothetical protein
MSVGMMDISWQLLDIVLCWRTVQTYLVDDGHHDRCAAVSEYREDCVRYGDSVVSTE